MLAQLGSLEEPEDRLRVPDVDRQEPRHASRLLERERRDAPVLVDGLPGEASRVDPVREEVAVVVGAHDGRRREVPRDLEIEPAQRPKPRKRREPVRRGKPRAVLRTVDGERAQRIQETR